MIINLLRCKSSLVHLHGGICAHSQVSKGQKWCRLGYGWDLYQIEGIHDCVVSPQAFKWFSQWDSHATGVIVTGETTFWEKLLKSNCVVTFSLFELAPGYLHTTIIAMWIIDRNYQNLIWRNPLGTMTRRHKKVSKYDDIKLQRFLCMFVYWTGIFYDAIILCTFLGVYCWNFRNLSLFALSV